MYSVKRSRGWGMPGFAELRRAASFRMALLFMGLYGVIAVLLFAFLYVQISGYAVARIDEWLPRGRNAMLRGDMAELRTRVEEHVKSDPENDRPFALFDRQGRRVAGTFMGPMPWPVHDGRPYTVKVDEPWRQHIRARSLRAGAYLMPESQVLVVSQDLAEIEAFNVLLLKALGAAAVVALLMGLAGAVLIGRRAMARLDAITNAIESIVSGDLSRRLPAGRAGDAGDDLDRLVNVVNGMLGDIERLMHEVKGACDNIAHDLRTPLARLLAGLERAQRRAGSAEQYQEAIEAAIGETLSLLTIFNAMLRISEVEDGARRSGFTDIDLALIADDAVEFYAPSADEKVITLDYVRSAALSIPMRGDASLLFEAIGNLIDNAIKFTPDGGHIAVTLTVDNSGIRLDVRDTGPGIAPAEREAVFLRFHRSEGSRHLPGNGLGLSLVAAVARLHGLQVGVLDSEGGCHIALRTAPVQLALQRDASATPAPFQSTATP
jgi:signal transduction histidine kinase